MFKFSGWYSNHFTDDLEMIASISPSMQNCDFQVDDYIKLYCTIQDSFEAELHIKAGDIDIFDHEKKYLSHEKLEQIYDTYWTLINTFSNKIIVL